MRIIVHDFSGHPFQIQLSRELAKRGHEIFHLYSEGIVGAKGNIQADPDEKNIFHVESVSIGRTINRYNFFSRLMDERAYGKALCKKVLEIAPQIVISSNTPLDAQFQLFKISQINNFKFVFWLQDILGLATKSVLAKKLGLLGSIIGEYYIFREKHLLRMSDQVVPISMDFLETLIQWGIDQSKITVINNWAPLDEMPQFPKMNNWRTTHFDDGAKVSIYSGALGLKHNPQLLWDLAQTFSRLGQEYKLVVISEGYGADWIKERLNKEPLDSLVLLPFQPFSLLPEILASADVLLAILEPEAGKFCVPSKVLSYMCVGRPIVLAADSENQASRLIAENNAGIVVDPAGSSGFCDAVIHLLGGQGEEKSMGVNSRTYAEENFDISVIAAKFDLIFKSLES